MQSESAKINLRADVKTCHLSFLRFLMSFVDISTFRTLAQSDHPFLSYSSVCAHKLMPKLSICTSTTNVGDYFLQLMGRVGDFLHLKI